MKAQYIIALVFHLISFPGILFAYVFAAIQPANGLFQSFDNIISTLIPIIIFILVSEAIVRVNFKTFKLAKHYSDTQYLFRRIISTFFLCGAIFGFMFAMESDPFGVPLTILYYLIITPLPSQFKKYTSYE